MATAKRRRDSNGTKWRAVRAKVIRRDHLCALCGQPVDKSLPWLDPGAPQVDHIIPVSKGGAKYELANLGLAHRACNRDKGDGTNGNGTPPAPKRRW